MAEMKDIVKLAVDAYKGNVEKYSVSESMDVLRNALIEANGGSTTLNYRNIRDGKCVGLFALVEEILARTVEDGLNEDMFFNSLVEYRNLAQGDQNLFLVEDSDLFVVSEAADGTQAVRRQRLGGTNEVVIPTTLKTVRIYEELNRVLAGRVDFNQMIDKVAKSFRQKLLNDVYNAWAGATAADLGGVTYFPAAGSYDPTTLLKLIAHVEAAAGGKQATLVGTKAALRNCTEIVQSDEAKNELHTLGFYGKFYGTPCVALPQRHKVGSTAFALDDLSLTIIAGDDKPIKVVVEGNPLVIMGDPTNNMDLTQEYFYAEKYGVGLVLAQGNSGIGRYQIQG